MRRQVLWSLLLISCLAVPCVFAADGNGRDVPNAERTRWCAGRWDSSIYAMCQHPHTVAIRVVVEDDETRMPLEGVEVTLEGDYIEEGRHGNRPEQEFELTARTDDEGIAVFGLLWHKTGTNEVGVDDIEKIERLEVRRNGYKYHKQRISLRSLQKDMERAWMKLIMRTEDSEYFVLLPGPRFKGYNNRYCEDRVFFDKIRREDYGNTFAAQEMTGRDFPTGFFRSNPQEESGPFMMLPVTISMERTFEEHHVEMDQRDDQKADRAREARRAEQRRRLAEKKREEAERQQRLAEAARQERRRLAEEKKRREERERKRLREQKAEARRRKEEQARQERINRQRRAAKEAETSPLGIAVETLSNSRRKHMGLFMGVKGTLITYVTPGSAADNAGLRAGMVIESITHSSVSDADDLAAELDAKGPGDQVIVGVWRKRGGKWGRDNKMIRLTK